MDMDAGRIDAMVVDAVLARYYMVKHPDKYVALEEKSGRRSRSGCLPVRMIKNTVRKSTRHWMK